MKLRTLLFTALLVLQAGLVVTGGAVRLTGSGLGCPTWPECVDGSITPVVGQEESALHAWIEFGNRLVAWLILILALTALVYIVRKFRNRSDFKRLRLLAILQILGFLGQVVLGGITVLTKLNPIAVSAHFVLTLPLIAGALALRHRVLDRPVLQLKPLTRNLTKTVTTLTFIVLLFGVVVTGTGPHAGDADVVRYPFDFRAVSWLHADSVIVLICLTIALYLVVKVSETDQVKKVFGRMILIFLVICLAQGLIGYVQYLTGLPALIVGAHLLGATLVWAHGWRLNLVGRNDTKTREKVDK
jgi:cytochrome c oxidase assembly protein subunit 15